jgi:hypothetical protein
MFGFSATLYVLEMLSTAIIATTATTQSSSDEGCTRVLEMSETVG